MSELREEFCLRPLTCGFAPIEWEIRKRDAVQDSVGSALGSALAQRETPPARAGPFYRGDLA